VPPMVSAVSVGGRRLHELARAGEVVERPARRVNVWRFEVSAGPEPDVLHVDVDCSSGTYVRALVADLGHALGCGAHLRNLRRTAVGSFTVEQAVTLDELAEAPLARVLAPAQAVSHLGHVTVDESRAAEVRHGAVLPERWSGEGPWAVLDGEGNLLAVYEPHGDGTKPAVVLAGADGSGQGRR
jgi:tRNA pseudouridine55 synthase